MHARSREHTKDEGTSRAHPSSMRRTVASVAKSATPAPANRIHGDRPARDEIANGASGRKLLLEVHESATLFTAGDPPSQKVS